MIAKILQAASCLLATLLLVGCVSETVKSTAVPQVQTLGTEIPEQQLLDVGIVIFDPGIDADSEDETLYPEVRRAEANYQPYLLAEAIQSSAAWGAVRVVPDAGQIMDLLVTGAIVNSHGERLELHIVARDARGRTWLDRNYQGVASRYSYTMPNRAGLDPFQMVYNNIANDLLHALQKLDPGQRKEIRLVSELRFASSMSAEAFAGHLESDDKGKYRIQRLPAEDDPMLARVHKIRERDELFIDTLQDYYASFNGQMSAPYQEWRKMSYEEAIALRELRRESLVKMVTGAGMVIAGIAAQTGDSRATRASGNVAVAGGAMVFKSGLQARNEAEMHVQALEELGLSLEAEIAPQVIELEDRSVTLTGNVQEQYRQWRKLLQEIHAAELGSLALPLEPQGEDS